MRRTEGVVVRPSEDLLHDNEGTRAEHANPNIEKYLQLSDQCAHLVDAGWFGWFITSCIVLAAVVIGWQTYLLRGTHLPQLTRLHNLPFYPWFWNC